MSNASVIFQRMRAAGMTVAGALGMIGNLDAESGCYPCRVQGDYKVGFQASKDYAERVDSGAISPSAFASDQKGWGLAQWTLGVRKSKLYTFCKQAGKSIADLEAQVGFIIYELKNEGEYSALWSFLCSTDDIYAAADKVCRTYERPAVNNVEARYTAAIKYQSEFSGLSPEGPSDGSGGNDTLPAEPNKTVGDLALEVLKDEWGEGAERRERLTSAGYDYNTVQEFVNRLVQARDKAEDLVWVALEILSGKWGEGAERKQRLVSAGYNYDTVQGIVNYALK